MGKISVFTNISLDGYFEGQNHDLSGFKNDFEAFPNEPSQERNVFLFGHRTYEGMKFWSTPQAVELMPEVARFMNETHKYVASRQPFDPGWQNVTVISGDVTGQVRKLKEQANKNLRIFGSNELVVSLLAERLVDEFQLVVNPVAFGGGSTLFIGLPGKVDFTLKDSRVFKSGAVMLTLEPVWGE
jgi:dihydrofolate reductase